MVNPKAAPGEPPHLAALALALICACSDDEPLYGGTCTDYAELHARKGDAVNPEMFEALRLACEGDVARGQQPCIGVAFALRSGDTLCTWYVGPKRGANDR